MNSIDLESVLDAVGQVFVLIAVLGIFYWLGIDLGDCPRCD